MSILYQVLGETGFTISLFEISEMFVKTTLKGLLVCPIYFLLHMGDISNANMKSAGSTN